MEYTSLGTIGAKKFIEEEFGELYTCDIIITDERLRHIKTKHPEDYDLFHCYGKQAVNNPDYIIKDSKSINTIFMVYKLDDTNLNVVVKVSVDTAHPDYKNSVITFYRLREQNLIKLKSKNKILYNKE